MADSTTADGGGKKKRKAPGGGGGGNGGGGAQGSSNSSSNGFKALGLSDGVYRGIVRMGFRMPTPVQRKALPVIMSGVDTVVMARTGSGKTIAFLIPLLEKLIPSLSRSGGNMTTNKSRHVRAVILSPTRELSMQTLRVFHKLTFHLGKSSGISGGGDGRDDAVDVIIEDVAGSGASIRAVGIHGGENMERQFDLLASRPDVIIATPGRLAHHLTEIPDFDLHACQMCILDEADRLLEMGFAAQIRQIAKAMPRAESAMACQKILLSATMPRQLIEFTKSGFAVDPAVVRLDQEATVSAELRIGFVTCRSSDKDAALLHIMSKLIQPALAHDNSKVHKGKANMKSDQAQTGLTLIFAATRHHVEYIASLLTAAGFGVTMIYGTLDQQARKSALSQFRSGQMSVLVVTDVAARGIDVPLIDHVIHYHFPPSPKLFVHRSGRAARAGRIGYCWALVEPDEMPYMMDLHTFLGHKPQTSTSSIDHKNNEDEATNVTTELMYSLADMTPEMVHYGSVPESTLFTQLERVQRILHSELTSSTASETARALIKTCDNAMKQYRRTRTEASREGVRRAKAVLEGERLETGQRISLGAIPPHPIFLGLQEKEDKRQSEIGTATVLNQSSGNGSTKQDSLHSTENWRKRDDFLRAMANFRPKETVFEAFATGNKKDGHSSIVSHVDKGRTVSRGDSSSKNKQDSNTALAAMKQMRRQMRMARDKGSSLVVAGTEKAFEMAQQQQGDSTTEVYQDKGDPEVNNIEPTGSDPVQSMLTESMLSENESKRRMSRSERKRLKKNLEPVSSVSVSQQQFQPTGTKVMRGADFRDPAFYMENDVSSNVEEAQRSRQIEAAMQPSAASANNHSSMGNAYRMEQAMLDIVGDEREDMIQKQRLMRWDKHKRKYVQSTVGVELRNESRTKKMRLESGQTVSSDKRKLGELYEKWQKKTNRSVGRSGVFDDADHDDRDGYYAVGGSQRGRGGGGGGGGSRGRSSSKTKGDNSSKGKKSNKKSDEIKSAQTIKKERERKQNLKVKNMKKSSRRVLEREDRSRKQVEQGRKLASVRNGPKTRK